MTRSLFLFFVLCGLPFAVSAQPTDIYAVQVGSYKHFAGDIEKSVRQFGDVHVFTFKNLSRVTVGEFTNRKEAAVLLEELKGAGFEDAFVRRIGYADLNKVQSAIEKFNVLIAQMDAHAFYLDGRMYLFQGDGYVRIPH